MDAYDDIKRIGKAAVVVMVATAAAAWTIINAGNIFHRFQQQPPFEVIRDVVWCASRRTVRTPTAEQKTEPRQGG